MYIIGTYRKIIFPIHHSVTSNKKEDSTSKVNKDWIDLNIVNTQAIIIGRATDRTTRRCTDQNPILVLSVSTVGKKYTTGIDVPNKGNIPGSRETQIRRPRSTLVNYGELLSSGLKPGLIQSVLLT